MAEVRVKGAQVYPASGKQCFASSELDILSAFPLLVDFHRMLRSRAFRQSFWNQEKVPTSMHSMRLEHKKLILVGTRTTY